MSQDSCPWEAGLYYAKNMLRDKNPFQTAYASH